MSNVESSRCAFEEIEASLADVASNTTGPIITDTTRGKRDDIPDTRDHAVIQKINHDAAEYCSFILFMNKDRLSYQTETRQHPAELLKQEKVGYTNGRVAKHLLRRGHDPEDIISSGLAIRYQNKIIDALPLNCFVYPFYDLDNNIGRFTTKDPDKVKMYQQAKRFWLPNSDFWGVNSLNLDGPVAIVEGENDRLTLMRSGWNGSILSTIGQISSTQYAWIEKNLAERDIYTFFDSDSSGDKYREKIDKLELPQVTQVLIPEVKDVDEYFCRVDGASLNKLLSLDANKQLPAPARVEVELIHSSFIPEHEVIEAYPPNYFGDEGATDSGNANRMARMFGHDLGYVVEPDKFILFKESDGCYRWSYITIYMNALAQRMARSIELEAECMLMKAKSDSERKEALRWLSHAQSSLNFGRIRSAIELVKHHVAISHAQLNSNPMHLGVQNGVIDLTTGMLGENRREYLITHYCPVIFDANATCPRWLQFLSEIMCNDIEMVKFLQLCVGYWITGRCDEQLLFFLYGHGSNGKSTFIQLIQEMLGSAYSSQINSEVLMQSRNDNKGGPNAAIAKLPGKRLVVANELSESARMDENLIKSITGNDVIVARGVYAKREIEFRPEFSLVMIGNHKPNIYDNSHGMWRRICLIGFDAEFSKAQMDPKLPDILRRELPGILNWAIQGCLDWQASEGLKANFPEKIVRANTEYRAESDLVGEFLHERVCQVDGELAFVYADDLYNAYRNFASAGNEYPMSKRLLIKKLAERGYSKARRSNRVGIKGISLVDAELGPYSTLIAGVDNSVNYTV